MSDSNSGIGLSIKVMLDDEAAQKSLSSLLENNEINLKFNSESLTQIESQMKELANLKFEHLLNEQTLAQFENMTTELTKQLELVQEMKQAFAQMSVPTEAKTYNEHQSTLYKEAAVLQGKIEEETLKIERASKEEAKQRRENLAILKESLDTIKTQITDQRLLNRLEAEQKALKANASNQALDIKELERLTKARKEEAEQTKRAQADQVDGYQIISKLNNQIYQESKKLASAYESERPAILAYIESLKKAKEEVYTALQNDGLLDARKDRKEEFNEIIRSWGVVVEQAHQQALAEKKINNEQEKQKKKNEQLAEQQTQKNKKKSEERKIAKELVQNAQKEYEIKLKSLSVGRNGEYVDQVQLAGFRKQLNDLNARASTKNIRQQLRQLSLAFRELSVDANAARIQQTGGAIQALNKSFQNLAKYVTGAMIIRQFFNEMRQGIQDVRDLDSAMVTLRMTMTDFTEKDITKLIDKSVELSKSLKTNVSDVLEAVKTVANAEETMDSIMNKTKPAIILSNLGGNSVGIGDAVNMIQSATRQFDDLKDASESSTMAVADSMVAISKSLGMDFSEGLNGLSEGITILGSVANQFGMNLNETLSMLAATAETTRASFSETATAIKTIMARTMRVGGIDENVSLDDMLKTGMGIKASPTAIIQ